MEETPICHHERRKYEIPRTPYRQMNDLLCFVIDYSPYVPEEKDMDGVGLEEREDMMLLAVGWPVKMEN